MTKAPYSVSQAEHISPKMAEVIGIVSAMTSAFMQREEAMRTAIGFDGLERAANLMDAIVDRVPELQRKLLAAVVEDCNAIEKARLAAITETLERAAKAARNALLEQEWPPKDGDAEIDAVMDAIRNLTPGGQEQ